MPPPLDSLDPTQLVLVFTVGPATAAALIAIVVWLLRHRKNGT